MKRAAVLSGFLVVEIVLFAGLAGNGWPSGNYLASYFADLLTQASPTLLVAFGMTLVLATSGIDLSAGSMVALISCVMSSFPPGTSFWWQALPAGLAVGFAAGSLNGFFVARLDVPPVIATLGTMIFFRGLCFVVMGDLERSPFLDVSGYDLFGHVAGACSVAALVFVAGGSYFHYSVWRREVLMIGGNRVAARYAAIPVERRLWQVYTLLGALAFLAAVTFTARHGSVSAGSLTGFELQVIVAVVLGGTKVQGGSATLVGTIFGVLFVAVLDEGLRGAAGWGAQHLPFRIGHFQHILLGLLLVGGVALNSRFDRIRSK